MTSHMGNADRPTVLVVEDEPPLVEVYARWLEGDYEVRTAKSGSEALDRVDEGVDVVLLDRLMPGMSGDEVLAELRDQLPECKVAMVTAVEPDFDIVTMGFDDYLTKPVEREELLATVERLLARDAFADLEREFYSLAARRAALQEAKSESELADSDEFSRLEARLADLEDELGRTLPDMGDGEFVAMVRELEDQGDRRELSDEGGDGTGNGGPG